VPTLVIPHGDFPDRATFDATMVAALEEAGVETVVLAGFMRLVTPVLLDAFPYRVVNIHPSLLPAFPGVDAQAQALAYGVRLTGCTVHFVDAGTDTGPVIAQAAVPVIEGDTRDTLAARILAEEHRLLVEALGWIAAGRVEVTPGEPGARARVRVRGALR
jgi:phosphoribosylglycinamide formyltransferase 1